MGFGQLCNFTIELAFTMVIHKQLNEWIAERRQRGWLKKGVKIQTVYGQFHSKWNYCHRKYHSVTSWRHSGPISREQLKNYTVSRLLAIFCQLWIPRLTTARFKVNHSQPQCIASQITICRPCLEQHIQIKSNAYSLKYLYLNCPI